MECCEYGPRSSFISSSSKSKSRPSLLSLEGVSHPRKKMTRLDGKKLTLCKDASYFYLFVLSPLSFLSLSPSLSLFFTHSIHLFTSFSSLSISLSPSPLYLSLCLSLSSLSIPVSLSISSLPSLSHFASLPLFSLSLSITPLSVSHFIFVFSSLCPISLFSLLIFFCADE